MPDNIVDVDAFTDPVQAPADGDDASEPIIQLAPQALANRTRNLKNRLDTIESSGNIVLQSGKTIDATFSNSLEVGTGGTKIQLTASGELVVTVGSVTVNIGNVQATAGKVKAGNGFEHVSAQTVVAMASGVVVGGGMQTPGPGALPPTDGYIAEGLNDADTAILKIPIPHQATVTRIRAALNCSTTPSTSDFALTFRRVTYDKVAPVGVGTLTPIWDVSKSTSGDTIVDSNSVGTFTATQINRDVASFECLVFPGLDGGGTCDSYVKWIELTYTMPGPVER